MSNSKIQGNIQLSTLSGAYHLYSDSSEDLVLMLHGKAGNRQVMSVFEKSFPPEANFIYPEADIADPIGGFSWWLEQNSENYQLAASKLQKFIDDIILEFRLKPRRIIACGFSQGGACLSWLSQANEGLFSHLIMICSFYLEYPEPLKSYPNTFIYHGLADQVVAVAEANKAVSLLISRQATVTFVADTQAHKISSKGMKALKDWLSREI